MIGTDSDSSAWQNLRRLLSTDTQQQTYKLTENVKSGYDFVLICLIFSRSSLVLRESQPNCELVWE